MNDFSVQLSRSLDMDLMWEGIYRARFPAFVKMETVKDLTLQHAGLDRLVTVGNGKYGIDEKVRERDYPDILLEYISRDTTQSPGWIEKPLRCDYIAYAFLVSQRCYFLPFPFLQAAWKRRKDIWMTYAKNAQLDFRIVPAHNGGGNAPYITYSLAVPIPILIVALNQEMYETD